MPRFQIPYFSTHLVTKWYIITNFRVYFSTQAPPLPLLSVTPLLKLHGAKQSLPTRSPPQRVCMLGANGKNMAVSE